ncbi:hypothetical protein vseg_003390 [Gypsophila vaccaria]
MTTSQRALEGSMPRPPKMDKRTDDDENHKENSQLCVIGKLWTKRNINLRALIDTMKLAWRPHNEFTCEVLDKQNKTLIFNFTNLEDKERVLANQHWHFERHALILSDIQGDEKPSDIPLYFIPNWVRVYDLPIKGRMNLDNARNMGSMIGSFIELDQNDNSCIRRSLRMRVIIDLRKPLVDSIVLTVNGGKEIKAMVRYENLSLFCYVCGLFGHGRRIAMNVRWMRVQNDVLENG